MPLLGALTGSTLLATGTVKLAALGTNFVFPLLLSPVVSLLLALFVYISFRQIKKRKAISDALCLCVENGPILTSANFMAEPGTLVLGQNPTQSISIDNQSACDNRYAGVVLGISLQRVIDTLHFFSAGAVCFARGLNDTTKIAALLLLAPGLSLQWNIILIALTMSIGGLLNARRVAETMSHKITTITHGQGLSATLTTAMLVIFASKFGLPVSTTHVSVGALFGIGLITKKANGSMIASILLSWLLTLPCLARLRS
jgi:PiT family inorganic phosphate transporter